MVTGDDDSARISLLEEQLDVEKIDVVTDRVRINTSTAEREVSVDYVLERGELVVERVPVDRQVDEAPEPRQDGDTLVVSLVEERLVVEKRLFVTEEIRITRTSTSAVITKPVTLRTMHATVERAPTNISTGRD